MDTRRTILTAVLALAIILLWQLGFDLLYRKMGWSTAPRTVQNTEQSAPATQSATSPGTLKSAAATTRDALSGPAISASSQSALRAVPATQSSGLIAIGSSQPENGQFALQLEISTIGAGIDSVRLNK